MASALQIGALTACAIVACAVAVAVLAMSRGLAGRAPFTPYAPACPHRDRAGCYGPAAGRMPAVEFAGEPEYQPCSYFGVPP